MKFKDKDGNVFEDIDSAKDQYCQGRPCGKCAVRVSSCEDFANTYPAEAARLMGYEVVEDETKEEPMKQDKPLSEWMLGEVKEYCRHTGCDHCRFQARTNGAVCDLKGSPNLWELTDPPRLTEEEVADARVLERALLADGLWRNEIGDIFTTSSQASGVLLDSRMFPSILPGQSVKLSEIVGGAE